MISRKCPVRNFFVYWCICNRFIVKTTLICISCNPKVAASNYINIDSVLSSSSNCVQSTIPFNVFKYFILKVCFLNELPSICQTPFKDLTQPNSFHITNQSTNQHNKANLIYILIRIIFVSKRCYLFLLPLSRSVISTHQHHQSAFIINDFCLMSCHPLVRHLW